MQRTTATEATKKVTKRQRIGIRTSKVKLNGERSRGIVKQRLQPTRRAAPLQTIQCSHEGDLLNISTEKPSRSGNPPSNQSNESLHQSSVVLPWRRTGSQQLSPCQFQQWILECENHHKHPLADEFSRQKFPIDILLIDTWENRLIKGTSSARYLVLSYVWGNAKEAVTTVTNRPALEEKNGLLSPDFQLPAVIVDTIALVKAMGERYLWVDAVCIEQDNVSQKHSQISQMDIIYSQALATIVALSGKDAASPLPGWRPGTRLHTGNTAWPPEDECTTRSVEFSACLKNSIYETRAWTYQERILSQRCLFFTSHSVWFHCPSLLCNDVKNVCQPGRINPLEFNSLGSLQQSRDNDWASVFEYYCPMVPEYSSRSLTFAADRLNAVAGVLAVFRHATSGDTPEGLLEKFLDQCLLWIPTEEMVRNHNFASWSWAGWDGCSTYYGSPVFPWLDSDPKRNRHPFHYPLPVRPEVKNFSYSCQTPLRQMQRCLPEPPPYDSIEQTTVFRQPALERGKFILYFETELIPVHQFSIMEGLPIRSRPVRNGLESEQPIQQIYDQEGRRCGSFLHYTEGDYSKTRHDLILLSTSQFSALLNREIYVHDNDGYAKGVFDLALFPSRPWCVLNVMLIVWSGSIAERTAICQIHEDAWRAAGPKMQNIILG